MPPETQSTWAWVTTTHFALDVQGLPEVIYTSQGETFLHLPGIIVVRSSEGDVQYLLSDGLGSVRQAADEAGAVVASYEFDPYGNPVDNNGGDPYGYTGEWWESYLNLLFLRARWYLAETGTFLSRDPVESEPGYQYVRGNPVNRIDPSGYVDWTSCIIGAEVGTCRLEYNDTLWGIAREIIYLNGNSNIYNNERINRVMVPKMQALNPNLYSLSFGWDCPTCLADTINLPASWINTLQRASLISPTPQPTPAPIPSPGPVYPPSSCQDLPLGPRVHKIGPFDIIFFPGGPPDLGFSYKSQTAADNFTGVGVILDIAEAALALNPPPISMAGDIIAVADAFAAGAGSVYLGETYIAQPDPKLPTMAVFGQDVMVATADVAVGSVGKLALMAVTVQSGLPAVAVGGAIVGQAADVVTSSAQAAYDASRYFGKFPTVVSTGIYIDENTMPRVAFMFYAPQ